ncbi:MAG: nucleotidyl transferase AbiEii/AbiGii toxin family protein [Bacteroidota bacterium]
MITYPDLVPFSLLCYPLEEVLIEKMCALMGRTEPRDLYDFWYLLEIAQLRIDHLWSEFSQKAQHKGYTPNQFFIKVTEKCMRFEGRWKGSLSRQINTLPHFETVIRNVHQHLRQTSKYTF